MENPKGEVISVYSQKQALEDGVLIRLTRIGDVQFVATANCYHTLGLKDPFKLLSVVMQAVTALQKPDEEDTDSMHLRVLHRDGVKFWVVLNGDGACLMQPEDY